MNKLLILISLLCVYAIKGEDSGGDGNDGDGSGDDGVAGAPPAAQHMIYYGQNLPGGRYPYAPRPYGGNRRRSGNSFNILTFLAFYLYLKDRRSTAATTTATTAATPAVTPTAVLSGYTSCPNGCQYRVRTTAATNAAVARTNCVADGAGVVLGHQMLRTAAQRRAVLEVCLGQTGQGNVMIYLEDSDGSNAIAPTWGPDFEPYTEEVSATLTHNDGAVPSIGYAVDSGFNNIEFEAQTETVARYLCEFCP